MGTTATCLQIRTGELTIESPWSYPLNHKLHANYVLVLLYFLQQYDRNLAHKICIEW